MKRRVRLRRTGAMPRISSRQQAIATERRVAIQAAYSRGQRCEYPSCEKFACDWHERLRRAQGGSPTDPANRVWVCRFHHSYIHDHPQESEALGLIQWRYREGSKDA